MSEQKLFTRNFTLVLIGQIISLFGNAILRFALPLYLLRQTGSSTLYGIVTACSFLPMILLSLAGGVIADRANKRNIMVALDFMTAGIILVYYLLYGLLLPVPLLIVVLMLLYGIAGAYQPAVQASIPVLLSRDNILKGNSAIKHSLKYKEKVFSCVRIKTNCYMAQMEIYIFFPISVWENKYSVEYKI